MPWSGANKPYGDSRAMYCYVEAWAYDVNDTWCNIAVKGLASSGGGYEAAYAYGVVTQTGHGSSGRSAEWAETGYGVLNGQDHVAIGTCYWGPFPRYDYDYNVLCRLS